MQRRLLNSTLIIVCLIVLGYLGVHAKASPVWDFPLPANLLENKNGHLTLVSRSSLLDADFVPNNLVPLKLPAVSGPHELRKEAALELGNLFAAAKNSGYELYVKSSYRSYQTQSTMYHNRLEKYGKDDGVVAVPGSSDHQTGLGVDVLNLEWARREGMTPAFGDTKEAKWMEANCAQFGFIIRYLPEKQEITGIIYEPWHLRYVGKEIAAYIMENRLSLEEFDQQVQKAIQDYQASGGNFQELVNSMNALPPVLVLDDEEDGEISIFYK